MYLAWEGWEGRGLGEARRTTARSEKENTSYNSDSFRSSLTQDRREAEQALRADDSPLSGAVVEVDALSAGDDGEVVLRS